MRDLNTLHDAALLRRHSRLVAADLAERAKPPVPPKEWSDALQPTRD